jgi:NADH:ubiquinone reductase (H+-translocating)
VETTRKQPCPPPSEKRRVLIVGGGYAGTTCAVSLARNLKPSDDVEILLIEPNPCQQALSELDLVAVGPPKPEFCELRHPQVFRNLPVNICYNTVRDVHAHENVVIVENGDDPGAEVEYWRLVIATGAVPFLPPVPGLAEHAITMWSVADAQRLQEAVAEAFAEAGHRVNHTDRERILSFTVVGGGATGIEIVGTLGQMLPKRLIAAGLKPADLRVRLLEGRSEILYDLPHNLRSRAVKHLDRLGVEVITDAMVEEIDDRQVRLTSGRTIDSRVTVWAGGARPDPDASRWSFDMAVDGRIRVDPYLKVEGHESVYAIGDVAEVKDHQSGKAVPMLAQMAIQEGPAAAMNVLREARGEDLEKFFPHFRGEFVSIGPRWGVGLMYGMNLVGLPAILMKRITYVKYWLQVGGLRLAWARAREMLAMQR